MINLHGVPYAFDTVFNSVQYTYSFSAFTDKNGVARITAGDGKTYLYKIYHSGFTNGQYPKDTLSFNIAVGKVYAGKLIGKSEAGKVYEQNIVVSDYKIPDYNITKNNYIESTKYALEINMKANDILISQNNGRTFSYWNPDSAGYMKYFVVDQNNFDKLQNGQAFEVYSEFNYQDNGTIQIPIPNNSTDWFVVCSNRLSTRQAQFVEFEANLIEGDFSYSSVESEFVKNCSFYPNPFNSYCKISVPSGASLVEIIDINGNTLFSTTETEFNWTPDNTINQGVYFVRAKINNRYYIDKIIYNK
ncbi:MAG: T9SS type A sorting domain-containing protein [Bacteroidetes bacterium]|nr:T9SS type A sorting domain-containing protein [Bacteroidota bacterium]